MANPATRQVAGRSSTAAWARPANFRLATAATHHHSPVLSCVVQQQARSKATAVAVQPGHETGSGREYDWISPEAEELIAKAYNRHTPLALEGQQDETKVTRATLEELEKLGAVGGTSIHFEPKTMGDRFAYGTMRFLRVFTHMFFREKYDHHAVVLETVAAVPGIVAAMFRHLRSLRKMERDHGWINPLQEEAENERMHLLIWMQVTNPTMLERFLVIAAQAGYLVAYTGMYAVSPKFAHRMVGYLEEEAVMAYTDFLKCIDDGKVENRPAPAIAMKYYNLLDDATLRDVVLCVRSDEMMHRDYNHMCSNRIKEKYQGESPVFMADDLRQYHDKQLQAQQQQAAQAQRAE